MIPLTEKLLADAGGWQAMKEARQLFAAGRVRDARYEPPELLGHVRGAETEFRSGLRITSKTDIVNTCTCAESRRWGRICAHSLAVGLAVLAPSPVVAPVVVEKPAPPANSTFSEQDGEPCALYFILPPNFLAAWEKDAVMLVVEAEFGGARKPFSTLNAQHSYRVDAADFALAPKLLVAMGGKPLAMLTLRRNEFAEFLRSAVGHSRITFGRATKVTVESSTAVPAVGGAGVSPAASGGTPDGPTGETPVPRLAVRREAAGLILTASVSGKLLIGAQSAWRFEGAKFSAVAAGLPAPYLRLLEGPMTIPADAADAFLAKELPTLARYFSVEGEVTPSADAVAVPDARFAAHFEGSLNFLTARLDAIYAERRVTLDSTGASLARFARNRAAELGAIAQLRACGFEGPSAKGEFALKGERGILSFFASALPRFQRGWTVTIGERFEHVTREVERVQPRMEVISSGEQWFDLRYELASGSGERFSGTDIARLLQAGQSFVKKGSKIAVFDAALLDEFENVLRDSAPRQLTPGTYRMERRQAGALDLFASEHGVAVGGNGAWRDWAAATRNLESLRAVPLGALEGVMRPYQKHGVYWLHFLAQNGLAGILADEMGLGKTLQALAFLRTLRGSGPSIVVCPSSLIFNWQSEAAKWTPELRVHALEGGKRDFAKIAAADLVITSYPLLRRDIEQYRDIEFSAALLDEAQHIKNPDSQNAQSAAGLRARHRFALTGTPMENTVRDIWSLMHFLMPGYLGSRADFRERFERAVQTDPAGTEAARLRRRIQPFMLRRTKKTAAADLPDKIEQVAYCELTPVQRELYTRFASATRTQLAELAGEKNAGKSRMLMLTALLRLRQAACDARLLGMENPPTADEASAKLELLGELLATAIDGGHRVLVFSQFVKMLDGIRERLTTDGIDYCYLDGSTKDRGGEVARFQNGTAPVFLISLKAGGTGLNLTAADTVIHFDPWWNPAVEAQATDRAHRIGQRSVVTSYKLIARDTVEEKILNLQAKKRAAIEATIESEAPLMEGLSMAEIEDLLGE